MAIPVPAHQATWADWSRPDPARPKRSARRVRRFAQIKARRSAKHAFEHRREGGGAIVAEIEGDARHRLAPRQPRQRREQTALLAPGRQTDACLLAEGAG